MMQADLFKARVYPFPVSRTVEVARMARFLAVVQGPRADAYYRRVCQRIAARLRFSGIEECMVRAELAEFGEAVRTDLDAMRRPFQQAEGGSA